MPVCVVRVCEVVTSYLPKMVSELQRANRLKALQMMLENPSMKDEIENVLKS